MIVSESAEEILESLWPAHEKGGSMCMKLSELKVMPETAELKELIEHGMLKMSGSGEICLTDTGLVHARDAVRRHRLAERLLTDVLAVKSGLIHEAACQFEHHLHKGIDQNVCTLLGHPRFCPHGQSIPPGPCCEKNARSVSPAVLPVSHLKPGEGGHIAYLHTTDPKRAQMLVSMGMFPGTEIKLMAAYPSLLFQLGESQFAVDKSIAGEIYVRVG
jgi:DtxR family Mn-dependent transcriptional regulator